ncbi:hypothetical protein DFH07DRAFT_775570 [Mycena maculata]|uniref:Uncharacterized protein n=1 Tax=Mycena maculata TaxID=230809 RepID=A0AAD7ITV4_9AGAR|nr:hypothetical protein DFH07DRAFT_775570 [Mycena maculata]
MAAPWPTPSRIIILVDLFEDAFILANTQLTRRYSGPEHHDYTSSFICQLLSNEDVLDTVEGIVFNFLRNGNRDPTPAELFRFKRAAYRFWTFCAGQRKKIKWFLSKFPEAEVGEMATWYSAVESWVTEMYPEDYFESEHQGGENHNGGDDEMFWECIGSAGCGNEEGFFRYDIYGLDYKVDEKCILDEGHERLRKKILDRETKLAGN